MPKREDWIKLHTRDLQDPLLRRLTLAQRAVYWQAQLLSKSYSEDCGYLVNRGRGMTDQEIALAMNEDVVAIRDGLGAAVEVGLVEHTAHSGYHLIDWNETQATNYREPKEQVTKRKTNQRARERAAADEAKAAAAPPPPNVVTGTFGGGQ